MAWSYTLEQLARAIGAETPPQASRRFQAVSTDTRTLEPGQVFFALSGENFDGNRFVAEAFQKGAAAAVAAVACDAGPCLVVKQPLAALQAFAAYHRSRYAPSVLAITGSCGKTTSKDFCAAVLASRHQVVKTQGNLNNEIGCPLSVLQIDGNTDAAIIEMGAASPGNIRDLCAIARPTESAVTLVAPSHLAGFGTIERVAASKGEIVESLPSHGVCYVNVDDPWCVRIAESFPGRKVRFGSSGDIVLDSCAFDASGDLVLQVHPVGRLRLPLPCRAHASGVLLAIAVGLQHGIDTFEEPLRAAAATPARFKIKHIGGIEVLDDTYNASPASMAAALESLAERPGNGLRIAALGDMLELGPDSGALHREVGALAARLGVNGLFALGSYASDMIEMARQGGVPHAEVIQDPGAMAATIRKLLNPGDCLLVKGSRGMRMERVIEALAALNE